MVISIALHHHHPLPFLSMENKSRSFGNRLINVRSFSYKLRVQKNLLLLMFLVSLQHVRYGLHLKPHIAMLPLNMFIPYVILYANSPKTFFTALRATKPLPLFRDLVSQADSHELFLSFHGTTTPSAAFNAQYNTTNSQGRGRAFFSRGTSLRGRGRDSNCHPPHFELCRTNGHYASSCLSLASYATRASSTDESLAKAFHAQGHVTTNSPDWHVDSGAIDHMTSLCDSLHQSAPYKGNASVLFRNGHTLPITHKGSSTISNNIHLQNVLVIPHLKKKLLSVSKFTTDYLFDVLFSQTFFHIHDQNTK
ncbi:hypothetical protein Tco_1566162 [Tanacetum coccineum]